MLHWDNRYGRNSWKMPKKHNLSHGDDWNFALKMRRRMKLLLKDRNQYSTLWPWSTNQSGNDETPISLPRIWAVEDLENIREIPNENGRIWDSFSHSRATFILMLKLITGLSLLPALKVVLSHVHIFYSVTTLTCMLTMTRVSLKCS